MSVNGVSKWRVSVTHETPHFAPVLFPNLSTVPFQVYTAASEENSKSPGLVPASLSLMRAIPATHLKYHQGFPLTIANQLSAQEESWKQMKSDFPGASLPSPLSSSLTNNLFDSFHSAHSQLWAPPPAPFCISIFTFMPSFPFGPETPLSVWLNLQSGQTLLCCLML